VIGLRRRVIAAASAMLGARAALPAQLAPSAERSPLRGCCPGSLWSSPALDRRTHDLLAADTLSGVGRVVRSAAASAASHPGDWTRIAVDIASSAGRLHRPQEAGRLSAVDLRAEGQRMAGRWWSHGAASYRRGQDQEVQWRNHAEPYAGLPYEWADSVGGTMRHDALTIEGGLATPDWRGWRAGLQLDYGIGQGARRNDPRPLFRRRVAELAPGVTFRAGAQALAAGVLVGWHREDLEIGGGSSTEFPVLFRLRGIGTFDRTQLISGERAVIGDVIGGHASYAWDRGPWHTAVGGTWRVATDAVRDGIAAPVSGGAVRRVRSEFRWQLQRASTRRPVELAWSSAQETARGTDPVFMAVNTIDEGRLSVLRVRTWAGPSSVLTPWMLNLTGSSGSLQRADLAAETAWRVPHRQVAFDALVRPRGRFSARTRGLLLQGGIAMLHVHGGAYTAGRPTRLTPTLAWADYAVLAVPRAQWTAALGWEQYTEGRVRQRVRAEVLMQRARAPLLDGRPAVGRESLRVVFERF
jgi:hypothetical protein